MTYRQLIFSLLLILIISPFLFFQSMEDALAALKNVESSTAIKKLKEAHPQWVIASHKNATIGMTYDSLIVHHGLGHTVVVNYHEAGKKTLYKIVEKEKEELCNVQYIYIDGRNRPIEKVKALQKMIISQYRAGTPFTKLNEKFSEDANPTGELNWFFKGMMVEEFDKAVRGKPGDSLFTIDIPEYHWHYVVLKKADDRMEEVTTSVSILITE